MVTSSSAGLTVETITDSGNCTTEFALTICLNDAAICGSVFPVQDGSGNNINVAGTYTEIVQQQNSAFSVTNSRLDSIESYRTGSVTAGGATGISAVSINYGIDGLGNVFFAGTFTINLATASQGVLIGTMANAFAFPATTKRYIAPILLGDPFEVTLNSSGQLHGFWDTANLSTPAATTPVALECVSYNVNL